MKCKDSIRRCEYCRSTKSSIGRKKRNDKEWIYQNWVRWDGLWACSRCYKTRYDRKRKEIRGPIRKRQKLDDVEKKCLLCSSTTTRIAGTKRTAPYPRWFCYKNGAICYKCKLRLLWHKRARKKGIPQRNFSDNRPLIEIIRKCPKYLEWRITILRRDWFTCRDCHKKVQDVQAHHIKPFLSIIKEYNIDTFDKAMNCEILWDINNGLTLCRKCHDRYDPRHRII